MDTLSVTVRYRPLRIGWCVRENNFEALRESWRLSYTMWGGRYNPIIPVDDVEYARSLVELFRVDILWAVSPDETINSFIKSFSYLPNPLFDGLFAPEGSDSKSAVILDITHPVRRLHDEHFKNNPNPDNNFLIYNWELNDPLSDVFLATFGSMPPKNITGVDYTDLVEKYLNAKYLRISPEGSWPVGNKNQRTFSGLSRFGLQQHSSVMNYWANPGFYFGSVRDFTDLVNYWNLRATDAAIIFFDPAYSSRFESIKVDWLTRLRARPLGRFVLDNIIEIYSKNHDELGDISSFGKSISRSAVDRFAWNGFNIKAPYMYYSESPALATIGSSSGQPQVTFQLLSKPCSDNWENHGQHLVVSVHFGIGLFGDEHYTLSTPNIPELNTYYGEQCLFEWFAVRSEPDGLGIISNASISNISVRALDVRDLIVKIFELVGIKAASSKPGLIAKQLIQQMDGLQGCRPFKITGVRKLIKDYGPEKSFTRSNAQQIIRAVFSLFEDLYIEKRPFNSKLNPDSVLDYLMKKNIFRAGLEFECPSCRLEFWISVDEVSTDIKCIYCGYQFNITPNLRHRGDWKFRRSGLFGRDDNQEGAIPVVLTLQQFDTVFRLNKMLYATAMELKSGKCKIKNCETDFIVVIPKHHSGRIQVAIGECKNRGSITEDDVVKLRAVAGAFPSERFDVFIVFAKLVEFSLDEIKLASMINDKYNHRAILLTDRELEPYYLYERTAKEIPIDQSVISFDEMAKITHQIYFQS